MRSLYSSPLVHNSLHLLQKTSLHSSVCLYTHIHTYIQSLSLSFHHTQMLYSSTQRQRVCTIITKQNWNQWTNQPTNQTTTPCSNSQDPSFHPSDEHLERKLLNTYWSEKYECTVMPKDAMGSYRGRESVPPLIFHLSTICKLNGQSHIQVFTSGEKELWDPLNKRLVGP